MQVTKNNTIADNFFTAVSLNCMDAMAEACTSMVDDSRYDVPMEKSRCVVELAKEFRALFCKWHCSSLIKVIEESSAASTMSKFQDNLWRQYLDLRSGQSFEDKWKSFLRQYAFSPEPLFYQQLSTTLFSSLILKALPSSSSSSSSDDITVKNLTYEEENAIRYYGGLND